jgi:quinol monooxygenase YgiN
LIKEIQAGALADPPLLIMLGFDHDFGFTKPEVKQASELFIGVTELFYKSGTGAKALRSLKKGISAAGERESGTLSLALYPDSGDADKLRIVGVYESQDYWINVHGKSEEVQEFQATTKDISDGVKVHMLKPVGGFLHKEKA